MAHSIQTKEAARDLFFARVTMSEISRRKGMPSRRTLHSWAEAGEATDGIPWEDAREKREAEQMQASRMKALQEENDATRDFLEQAKEDVKKLYRRVRDKVLYEEVEVKPKDVTEMLRLFSLLENQEAEVQLKHEKFVRKVFQILIGEVDERQFASIKNKVALMMREEEAEQHPIERTRALLPASTS